MRAIFFESQGKWCSSVGAVAVPNQSLGKCWGWEGSLGHMGTAHCPHSTPLSHFKHGSDASFFILPSLPERM